MPDVTGVGVVLLAAGGSARMGRPKQLLPFQGTTLLRHAAGVATASGFQPVVVVLGASADRMVEELADLPVVRVVNADWKRGMGTSIRVGVRAALTAAPHLSAVIVTLADLPLVTPQVLCELIDEHRRSGRPLVACRYADTAGVPALFSHESFAALLKLPDGDGAKRLLRADGGKVGLINFPGGEADIDTRAEYEQLTGQPPASERSGAPSRKR